MRNIWIVVHKLVDWFIRPRSTGLALVRTGTLLIALSLAGGFVGKIFFSSGDAVLTAQYDSTGATISAISYIVLATGLVLTFLGVGILVQEQNTIRRKKIIVIEQRGLYRVDTELSNSLPPTVRGSIDKLTIDIREGVVDGKILFPEIALKKVTAGVEDLKRRVEDHKNLPVDIIYGGLMAVPFTFLTGCLLDDESSVSVFDWDRVFPGKWRKIEAGNDDDQRLQIEDSFLPGGDSAVLALSISYEVDISAVKAAFGNSPILHLKMANLSSDTHWSIEKQAAISQQFFDALKKLDSQGAKTINLIIAAPNSLVFNLGRIYDRRNLPNAVIHQYEKTQQPAYPWGVRIPTHGIVEPSIVYHPDSKARD